MKTSPRLRLAAALALAAALLGAAPLLAQGAPVGGAIHLALTPSTATPAPSDTFTVDLGIDLSAATGTCSGGTVVPMTLGAYNLGIQYDSTKLGFVSTGACPSAPAEFSGAPACVNNTATPTAAFVNCNAVNPSAGTASTTPQGNVCVVRVTFQNLTASVGDPASLVTLHTGGARGISTENIASCGGPVTFPSADVVPGSVTPITPVGLLGFDAE
jgi:hypothetical protein